MLRCGGSSSWPSVINSLSARICRVGIILKVKGYSRGEIVPIVHEYYEEQICLPALKYVIDLYKNDGVVKSPIYLVVLYSVYFIFHINLRRRSP